MVMAGMTPDLWQSELLRSDWQQALLLCSRQSGKSTVTAALALHQAIYQPGSLVLLLSGALRQSMELFRTVMSLYNSLPRPPALDAQTLLRMELSNGSRVIALPGKESTVRGFAGVDLLVIDEAAKVLDTLYFSVRPMLAVSGGRLIGLSTPYGKRGWFHQEWTAGGEDWRRVKVTASQCPRISKSFLESERRSLGELWFRQEYECQFVETVDQIFGFDIIEEARSAEVKPLFARQIHG